MAMDDRIRIDKLPPAPWPELNDLLRERARLREEALAAVGDHQRVTRLEAAVARARAEAIRRGEELAADAPELTALAEAREEAAALDDRRVVLMDAIASVEADVVALIDGKRASYLDDLGKRRGPAEERVGKALQEAETALRELAEGQALYAYLDDWPETSWQTGAYAATGLELPLRGADGEPFSVGQLTSALREAAGRPRRARRARVREAVTRALH